MSEETTHNLPDSRSFEERIFARFDALASDMLTLRGQQKRLEVRMDNLEAKPVS